MRMSWLRLFQSAYVVLLNYQEPWNCRLTQAFVEQQPPQHQLAPRVSSLLLKENFSIQHGRPASYVYVNGKPNRHSSPFPVNHRHYKQTLILITRSCGVVIYVNLLPTYPFVMKVFHTVPYCATPVTLPSNTEPSHSDRRLLQFIPSETIQSE